MNRMIAVFLILALALSMTGCVQRELTDTATPAPDMTATPGNTDTPAPTATGTPEIRPGCAYTVDIQRHADTLLDDAGAQTLLHFFADDPHLAFPEDPTVEARVNAVLAEDYRLFVEGTPDAEWSGKQDYADEARADYDRCTLDGTLEGFYPYTLERTADVTRGDERVLSLTYLDVTYLGGAHGYNALYGVSFDMQTGEKLSLRDLSDDPDGFLEQCADWLWEESRSGEHTALVLGGYYDDYEETLPSLLTDGNWYFNEKGIVVIANPYDIAPYAAGRIEFLLPWDWLRWQIREEYLPAEWRSAGTLTGVILNDAPAADHIVDDATNGQGGSTLFTADGTVEDVRLTRVSYADYNDSFFEEGTLWYASRMDDGETLLLRTWYGDVLPTLKLSWRGENGVRQEKLLFQSGMDGSLVLMDGRTFEPLPLEISERLPFAWDLDGDGEDETIELVNTLENGAAHWQLHVDGEQAGDAYALDASLQSLWLTDLDGDGVTELLFSGDMGSDDYVTCAWRGDTLEPISFTGEARRAHDPAEQTLCVDGRVVFSYGQFFLESWSYQLGTYAAVRAYAYSNGVISPADYFGNGELWSYTRNRTWLTVTKPLPVHWPDGGTSDLPADTELLLTGTDGNTAYFRTRDDRTGALELEYRRDADGYFSGWYINGAPEDDYFAMLPYAG